MILWAHTIIINIKNIVRSWHWDHIQMFNIWWKVWKVKQRTLRLRMWWSVCRIQIKDNRFWCKGVIWFTLTFTAMNLTNPLRNGYKTYEDIVHLIGTQLSGCWEVVKNYKTQKKIIFLTILTVFLFFVIFRNGS
jgi:hypothetical protein